MVGSLRFAWSTLTSMRTALILLLVLGIAAIPGSLLPQRPTDPLGVAAFLTDRPQVGEWLHRLGFFDVFGSPWFAAIYLLLFISLIGCILPRTAGFLRELGAPPAPAPGRLSRLAGFTTGVVERPPAGVLDAAAAHLRAHGYRVRRDPDALSAERGYLRETGNLVFHICLVVCLVGLGWGALFSFRGTAVVVEGQAFSNTLTQYDEFGAGAGFSASNLSPFTVRVDSFDARFETGPVQTGAARGFTAAVTVTAPDRPEVRRELEVNAPLQLGGDQVHLLGHGYAPVVTVRDGNGDVAFSGPVVFLPQDTNFRSDGVVKVPDARPERLAFEGVFLPTAVSGGASGLVSAFPDALDPRLLVNAWAGPPRQETGLPESVYVLDRAGLTQLGRRCRPGDGGAGTRHRVHAARGQGVDQLRRLEALGEAADLERPGWVAGAGRGDGGRARHGRLPHRDATPALPPGRSRRVRGAGRGLGGRPGPGGGPRRSHRRGGGAGVGLWVGGYSGGHRRRGAAVIAYYSSLAMVTSAVLYVAAMALHAAEWAAARTTAVPRREPVVVGAGTGEQQPAAVPVAPAPGRGVDLLGRVGIAITLIAALTHLAGVVLRGVAANRAPWGNMYEFTTSSLAMVAVVYLVLALAVRACAGSACRSPCC